MEKRKGGRSSARKGASLLSTVCELLRWCWKAEAGSKWWDDFTSGIYSNMYSDRSS